MNESSKQKFLYFTNVQPALEQPANQKILALAKEILPDCDYVDIKELHFTDSGIYKSDFSKIDFDSYNKVIFFTGYNTEHKKFLVRYLRMMFPKIKLFNDTNLPYTNWSWEYKFDTYLYLQMLDIKIGIPKTLAINPYGEPQDVVEMAKKYIGAFPMVLKPSRGSRGRNILLIQSEEELLKYVKESKDMDWTKKARKFDMLQQYIQPERREDLRVIILNGKIVGAMKRISTNPDEFRTNYSLGATIEKYDLTDEDIIAFVNEFYEKTKAFTAGFDFIRDKDGSLYLLELSTLPQSGGFNQVNDTDFLRLKMEAILRA